MLNLGVAELVYMFQLHTMTQFCVISNFAGR